MLPGFTLNRALTDSPAPPADAVVLDAVPPWPPSALIVTKQIPGGTGFVVEAPGVVDVNNGVTAAVAGPAPITPTVATAAPIAQRTRSRFMWQNLRRRDRFDAIQPHRGATPEFMG